MKETRLVTLRELAKMSGRTVNEVLTTAQEAKALRLHPGDNNIFVDLDVFMAYLDEIINEEVRVLNGK